MCTDGDTKKVGLIENEDFEVFFFIALGKVWTKLVLFPSRWWIILENQ